MPAGGFDAPINTSYLSRLLQAILPSICIFVSKAVTNHVRMVEQLQPQPNNPGTWFVKGAGGLGWF